MSRPAALSPDEAKERILYILEEGIFELSGHCKQRMEERSAEDLDVIKALKNGEILRAPVWDENHLNWKYRVDGKDTEGDDLAAITVIIEANLSLYIVTIY